MPSGQLSTSPPRLVGAGSNRFACWNYKKNANSLLPSFSSFAIFAAPAINLRFERAFSADSLNFHPVMLCFTF